MNFMTKEKKRMKVFISWSGEVSFQVAKVLKEWIPCVIQEVQPYFSSEDIDKGARWSTDIAKELETASFGILCVTKDNLESQWLNFEAGALSKAIDKQKVCPLLYHLKPSDISDSPILQFQMANVEKSDIFKLFKSINASLENSNLDEIRLEKVFDTFWPQMEKAFKEIKDPEKDSKKTQNDPNSTSKIMEEMLELLRYQQMMLKNPDKILPPEYLRELLNETKSDFNSYVREMIPKPVITELLSCEESLNRMMLGKYELSEEYLNDFVVRVREYIGASRQLRRYLGIKYPSFGLFRREE